MFQEGKLLKTWGSEGSGPGQFEVPQAIAIDRRGSVYVADTGNIGSRSSPAEGSLLGQCGAEGSGPTQFRGARQGEVATVDPVRTA
jgi:tripartite motif-containing protein 71